MAIAKSGAQRRLRGEVAILGSSELTIPTKIGLSICKLNFLGAGKYRADLLGDKSDDNAAWNRIEKNMTRRDWIRTGLRRNGGFVARFTKIN